MNSPDPTGHQAAAPEVREEILAPLRRVLDWMLSLRDDQGRIMCPEHGVEHTGKSAGALVLALELAKHAPDADKARLQAAAIEQGRRLAANLVCEDASVCHTFRPGRHDPFNCSNSVIDGGACSDALGQLVRELDGELEPADREAFAQACVLHAKSYLRYAVLDKGIPAQRAWGLTGLASAWRLAVKSDAETASLLESAAIEATGMLEGIQNADGSYPYHPAEWGAAHEGAGDVSAFYQSRVTAFVLHGLGDLGRDPLSEVFWSPLERGLNFLSALVGPDGIKCGLLEAKPWYWGANYEVASHPFDVSALAAGYRLSGKQPMARAALAAFRAWSEHLDEDGAPRSHLDGDGRGRSYQCPIFWAGHTMWMARAARDLELAMQSQEDAQPDTKSRITYFKDCALVRLEDEAIVAWVRGSRPAYNVAHGSPHGAGLLRVVRKSDGAELLPRCRLGGQQQGEWSGHAGLPSLARGLRAGREELRFSVWRSRVHWRAARRLEALKTPLSTLRRGVLAFAHSRVSSAFGLQAELELLPDGVRLRCGLAHRGGQPIPGAELVRTFRVDGAGLCVHEQLISPGAARGVVFSIPEGASELERRAGELSFRLD